VSPSLYAIIVAGGSGNRMQNSLAKQFIPIGGLPVLMHTVRCFYNFSPDIYIILVLPEKDISTWEALCKQYHFNLPVTIISGGVTRFHSVQNGLSGILGDSGLVVIHDGVRPFVSHETIRQSFQVANDKGSAIAVIPLKDSIRKLTDAGSSCSVNRNNFCLVQTPQTFQVNVIKQSYAVAQDAAQFTDDASVAENAGFTISLIEGSYQNIKITTPEDLIWAEAFLSK
jgi:2-C-methyl-D-erythritol 4-phosphate cytidylyltransferase